MTSKLLSNIPSNPTYLSSVITNNNIIPTNYNYNINIRTGNFNQPKEELNNIHQKFNHNFFGNNNCIDSFINSPQLISYDAMLKKNIRSFNIFKNSEKIIENKFFNSVNEKYNLDIILEINFKFTCDYELIKSEIKQFLELFGDINNLEYDMNANSIKIKYKYFFSIKNINNYLNHLFYEIKNEKDNNDNKKEKIIIDKILNKSKNEDIDKFINYLTSNYKNYKRNKSCGKENKLNKENAKLQAQLNDNKNNAIKIIDINKDLNSSLSKNNTNSEKNYNSKNNNSSKFLFFQQNSETPIKKTNIITNYSENNINSNIHVNKYHTLSKPFRSFNQSFKPHPLYLPIIPKKNIGIPISIPILFPMNSPFINKSFYTNNDRKNINNINKNAEVENKINSCLINYPNNNPINTKSNDEKIDNENTKSQNQNDIQIISNNSNSSTKTNEKNEKNNEIINDKKNNGSNQKTISDIGSNNNILSNKSDSTIKTEEVNKSSNDKSNNQSDENIKYINNTNNNLSNNIINKSNNNNNSSNKNSSSFDFMSSFKGKTLSLERLNNYLQENKPVKNFANPILTLNSIKKENSPKKYENSNSNSNSNNTNNNIKDNNMQEVISRNIPSKFSKNRKNYYPRPINNYFNTKYDFLFLSNPGILPKLLSQNIYIKPNPINFNKNVIDFNKLTLETKNKVHFNTHSYKNYSYKYICNYKVQIENDNIFMVTKRIIGKNGCFLKKILQESCIKYGDYSTKIRLRGKGSGYDDKIDSLNNNEPLILSVSSLNYPTYYNCCLLVDALMVKIYDDYFEYLHMILPKDLHASIHKKKLIKNEFIVDRIKSVYSNYENKNNYRYNNKFNKKKNNSNEDKIRKY